MHVPVSLTRGVTAKYAHEIVFILLLFALPLPSTLHGRL